MRQLSEATQERLREMVKGIPGQEAEVMLIKAIARDFELYRERNLMIRDKDTGAIIPLELTWAQQALVDRVMADLAAGRPVRYIILKARQMGFSTIVEGICFWWTSTHRNISSVIMAHEADAARNLYEMFRIYYQNAHPSFQPALKYNTKKDLTFDEEEEVKQTALKEGRPVPGLGSQIVTSVAKEGKGRGSTQHFFHASECAFYEDSADVVSGMLQTVPLAPNTFVFLESTANGVGTYFFNEWMSAEKGESSLTPFFMPWWKHSGYELDENLGTGPYSEFEQELLALFAKDGIDEATGRRKVAWARRKQLDFKTEPKKFFQEYPHTPMAAFLASGNYAFSVERLLEMQEAARAKPVQYGELYVDEHRATLCRYVEQSPLKVWYPPQKGMRYVVGGDVAEGITVSAATGKEGDYSVATVMEVETLTVVARWRGHIDPDLFGDVLFDLGTWYNNALLGPEINNHGIVVLQKLINRFYRNLFRRENSAEHQFQEPTALMGWRTDRATKPRIVKQLAAAIREGDLKDFDPVFIGEALTFMQSDKGSYDGKANGHDDTVLSTCIAVELAEFSHYDVDLAKKHVSKENHKRKPHGPTNIGSTHDDDDESLVSKRRSHRSDTRAHRLQGRAE